MWMQERPAAAHTQAAARCDEDALVQPTSAKVYTKHLIKKQKSSAFASFGLLDLGWVQLL
jgi:hypothetical protein